MVLKGLTSSSGRESSDAQMYDDMDIAEDHKYDDIASGLPFVPITLVRLICKLPFNSSKSQSH
jgi:hypothetical protein